MEKTNTYIQVMVNGEKSLPKEDGWYQTNKSNIINKERFIKSPLFVKDWLKNIEWYIIKSDLQLSMPGDEELDNIGDKEAEKINTGTFGYYTDHSVNQRIGFKKGFISCAKWLKSQCKVIDLREELVKFADYNFKEALGVLYTDEQLMKYVDEYLKQQ